MNNIQNLGYYNVKNKPVVVENMPNNVRSINFKSEQDRFTRQSQPRYSQPAILTQVSWRVSGR